MVVLFDKKYACQTCIKGHRSSGCNHTDRPLFEIKKKGRPVTQCEHCRELRRTKQVHIKCNCDNRDSSPGATTSYTGLAHRNTANVGRAIYGPVAPAFPGGLNGASTGQDASKELPPCHCGSTDGDCKCWQPRKRPASHKSRSSVGSTISTISSPVPSTPILDPPTNFIEQTNAIMTQKTFTPADFGALMQGRNSTLGTTSGIPMDFDYQIPLAQTSQQALDHELQPQTSSMAYTHQEHQHQHQHQQTEVTYDAAGAAAAAAYSTIVNQQMADSDTSSEVYFPWSTPSGHTPAQTVSTCRCGPACSCPGCAEHANYDGTMASSMFCTSGCASGEPCANSIHNAPVPGPSSSAPEMSYHQQSSHYQPEQDPIIDSNQPYTLSSMDISYQTLINSTPTPPTATPTLPIHDQVSHMTHNNNWRPVTPDPVTRRTGFTTSGERASCCSASDNISSTGTVEQPPLSMSEYQQYTQDIPQAQNQPYYDDRNSSSSSSISSLANLPGLHTPLSTSPNRRQTHRPSSSHSRTSSHPHPPKQGVSKKHRLSISNIGGGNSGASGSGNSGASSTGVTKSLKGSIKRLLPRPPTEEALVNGLYQSILPTGAIPTENLYYQGNVPERGPLTLGFNRFM